MALDKLRYGFLLIHTLGGPQYVQPTFGERIRLIWIFRNFSSLSERVLTARQRRLVAALCCPDRLLRHLADDDGRAPLIGTLIGANAPYFYPEDNHKAFDLAPQAELAC